jgi:tRNA modification GTPase
MVELSLHGSPAVLDMTLKMIVSLNARPANRGEFSLRAFLAGHLDLVQAEAVIDLIEAPGPSAVAEARARLDGALSRRIYEISDAIKDLIAELEAHIDFDEDDNEFPPDPKPRLRRINDMIRKLTEAAERGRLRREGIRTVIIGKPNVGKSTLFNRLLQAERAIVTPYPGTTRDTLEDRILIGGISFILYDTAGIRENPEHVEKEGIRRSYEKIDQADLVIALVNGSAPLDHRDAETLDACSGKKTIIVLNKKDLGLVIYPEAIEFASEGGLCVPLSAKTGEGLDQLENLLVETAALMAVDKNVSNQASLNSRCLLLTEKAQDMVHGLMQNFEQGLGMRPEIASLELRQVLAIIEEMTGERVDDGILDRIFERFCVGK